MEVAPFVDRVVQVVHRESEHAGAKPKVTPSHPEIRSGFEIDGIRYGIDEFEDDEPPEDERRTELCDVTREGATLVVPVRGIRGRSSESSRVYPARGA
jgi:hypothetical protein